MSLPGGQTVVVVDMQPEFLQAVPDAQKIVGVCRAAIQQAQQLNNPVVFLEIRNRCACPHCLLCPGLAHTPMGPTLPELIDVAGPHYLRIKHSNDGSPHVQEEVVLNRLPEHFLVMGVNTDVCVLDTIRGLKRLYPTSPLEVLAEGCGSELGGGHLLGLEKIAELLGKQSIL